MNRPGAVVTSVLIDDSSGGGRSHWFEGPRAVISAASPEEVPGALSAMERARAEGAHLAGFFAYELGYVFEPRLRPLLPPKRAMPLLWFGVFDRPVELGCGEVAARLLADGNGGYRVGDLDYAMDREGYRGRFGRVKSYIAAGDIYQLDLTFKARFDFGGSPAALYADLRARQPVAHGALIRTPQFSVVCSSPELFLDRRGREVSTRPMKGTASRAPTAALDQAQRDWLWSDPKSRAENLMIVDLMRNDLGRVAELGSVRVDDLFTVETFTTLHQMTSGVRARLREGVGLGELLASVFPPGSVTGAPKLRAIEILRELEDEPRGVYTGAIGMISPDGDVRFNVAIRTLTLTPDGRGEIGIGSGIVQDSRADDEYDECLLKLRFLSGEAQPFELIETMRHDPGAGFYLLGRHIERLGQSAAYFGFAFDRDAVAAALATLAEGFGPAPHRVRLLLARDGGVTVTAAAIAPAPKAAPMAPMTYVFSEARIDTGDPFLYHKTTRRALYDGEHARLAAELGCDEVLFLNERGELAEGSRTNIFVEKGGRLLTPALACGLLPGTLRAELIASGKAREAVLTPRDLEGACVFLGNSVRGLVRAEEARTGERRAAGGGRGA